MKKIILALVSIALVACSSDSKQSMEDPVYSIKQTEYNINFGDTARIVITPDSRGFTFTSQNEKHARVDNGLISAVLVGETYIDVSNEEKGFKATCKVVVKSTSNKYDEPIFLFGKSKEEVKASQTGRLVENVTVPTWGYQFTYDDCLTFKNEGKGEVYTVYAFEGGKAVRMAHMIQRENDSWNPEVWEHVKQHYSRAVCGNGYWYFTPDFKYMAFRQSGTNVVVDLDDYFYVHHFLPYNEEYISRIWNWYKDGTDKASTKP